MNRQRPERATAARNLADPITAAGGSSSSSTVEPAGMLEDMLSVAGVGVGAGEGDVLGIGAEKLALERVREARGEGVGVGSGGEEDELEGVLAVGRGAALEDEVVVAVEDAGGFRSDFLAGEEEGGDVAVAFRCCCCCFVGGVSRLVANVLLASWVRAWL